MRRLFFFKRHGSSVLPPHTSSNLENNPFITKETQILNLCKSGSLLDAIQVLNSIHSSHEITVKPILYASLLQTCVKVVSFNHGLQIHAHIIKSGLDTDRFIGNNLLSLYFKLSPDFSQTERMFRSLFVKDVVSWTSMITRYNKIGKPGVSIGIFQNMLDSGIEPNGHSLSAVIKACSEFGDLKRGTLFHGLVLKHGFVSNHVIISSLIDMYGRNYESRNARKLFDELPEPDSICWTSVISAFTRNDFYEEGLRFFYLMHRIHGLLPDGFTFGPVLTACGNLKRLRQGKEVHSKVILYGLVGNVVVESSLVDMYGKCGSLLECQKVFDRMEKKNLISWSALLASYCHNSEYEAVIRIFREFGFIDLYNFGTVLRACSGLAAVRQGKEVHCQYVRRRGWRDVIIESALVDLYAKCGCIDFAYRVFAQMTVRNYITWNSMIFGFAQNGRGLEALEIFNHMMINEDMKPDYITFIGVLFACSHAGLVNQGRNYFNLMINEFKIKPGIEHYNCMVDLLARAGLLEEAENLIEGAECRDDSSLWQVLLGACTTFTDSGTAERIAKKMMELQPDHHLSYVYLGNVYKAIGRWDDAAKVRTLMRDRHVEKMPGQSWIESNKAFGFRLQLGGLVEPEETGSLAVENSCDYKICNSQ